MYVHAHDAVVTVPLGFALPQPTFVPSMRHTFVYVTMLQHCYICHLIFLSPRNAPVPWS